MAEWTMRNGNLPKLTGIPVLYEWMTVPEPWYAWRIRNGSKPEMLSLPKLPVYGCLAGNAKLKEVRFQGTLAQWEAIRKSEGWNASSGFDRVICTDGIWFCTVS